MSHWFHTKPLDDLLLNPIIVSYVANSRSEPFTDNDKDERQELLNESNSLPQVVFFRLSIMGLVVLLRPDQEETKLVDNMNEEVVGISKGSHVLKHQDVSIIHLFSEPYIVIKIYLIDERIAIPSPHACPELRYHDQSPQREFHQLDQTRFFRHIHVKFV